MIDVVGELLDELEDEDDASTAKKGLSVIDGGKGADKAAADKAVAEPPAPADDKLAQLVAALTPEEKAKLRALLDEDDQGGAPPKEE